jgi:Domain of unknown function (DUF2760)
MSAQPSLFARLWLAITCWFRIVFDPRFAARVAALRSGSTPALPGAGERPALARPPDPANAAQALHLLSLLQREGRLIDFCEEDLAGFSDAQVGAAARTVHDGCRKAVREAFTLVPVRAESEGSPVTLPAGFDPRAVRLTGNVTGSPPFSGVLRHHGWRAAQVRMPVGPGDSTVIAPAEVELP